MSREDLITWAVAAACAAGMCVLSAVAYFWNLRV